MRLFVALDLNSAILARLLDALALYRRQAPHARWSRAESFHLTLKFIGEIDPAREPELVRALRDIRQPAFDLHLAGLGAFPHARRPRVFWAGVSENSQLAALARAVDNALIPLGFAPEDRPFSPHLTLARAARPTDLLPLMPLVNCSLPDWGSQSVTEFYLYQSHPARGSYHYEKRARFPLSVDSPGFS